MLEQYCRYVVSARRVGEMIESLLSGDMDSGNWIADYNQLLIMQEREGRAMSSLATRMRLSQQSKYTKNKSKGGPLTKKPWD
jgi:hypothetical protein